MGYLREIIESKRRERDLKRQEKQAYKQIKRGNDKKLQEVATDIAPKQEKLVPPIVGAITDERRQVETIGKVAKVLSAEAVLETVNQVGDETIAEKFNTQLIPKRNFQRVLIELAIAGAPDKFVLALCQEKKPYENLYKVIDTIEKVKDSKRRAEGAQLNHFQIIDIIKELKQDDRIRDEDDEGKMRCISLYMAYKIAKYGKVFPLSQFLAVLKGNTAVEVEKDQRNKLPEKIQEEYDKIVADEKVPVKQIHEYDKAEYEGEIIEYIKKEQEMADLEKDNKAGAFENPTDSGR